LYKFQIELKYLRIEIKVFATIFKFPFLLIENFVKYFLLFQTPELTQIESNSNLLIIIDTFQEIVKPLNLSLSYLERKK
jgi:hypothetical protein